MKIKQNAGTSPNGVVQNDGAVQSDVFSQDMGSSQAESFSQGVVTDGFVQSDRNADNVQNAGFAQNEGDWMPVDDEGAGMNMQRSANTSRHEDIGLPDPNTPVGMRVSNHGDYAQQASGGAQVVNGVDVDRRGVGFGADYNSMPNQTGMQQMNGNGVNYNSMQSNGNGVDYNSVQTGNGQAGGNAVTQMGNAQGAGNGAKDSKRKAFGNASVQSGQTGGNVNTDANPKKKSKLPLILIVLVVIVAIVGVVMVSKNKSAKKAALDAQTPASEDYATSGRYAYDQLQAALNDYSPETLDTLIGIEEADSYLAQEWAYVNGVKLREELITKVCSLVKFDYPMVDQKNASGGVVTDASGQAVKVASSMNGGEKVTVTVPDYGAICESLDENAYIIEQMYEQIDVKSYEYNDAMANLLCQYILDYADIDNHTKQVEIQLNLKKNNGVMFFESDDELDKVLFSQPEFWDLCTKFSQICLGFTGFKDEYYTTTEFIHNPEYDEWKVIFDQYFNADGGKFTKGVSKWEPWYLRDESNVILKDENGENIVNYYSVKLDDGSDWVQPDENVKMDLEHVRQIEDTWVEETGIMFNWIGTWWIQNEYKGLGTTIFRVGDGTKDNPAGIGTPIITKVLCQDGKYHDVRVTLLGYWIGDNAIQYCQKFDKRNRGFVSESTVKLITFEVKVENLEGSTIVFDVSEMALADKYGSPSDRTGTMYGFSETATIKPHESLIINDWANSTDIEQKYVIWGKTFNRQFQAVYFDALAGTGVVPEYSAYDQFVGKDVSESNMD